MILNWGHKIIIVFIVFASLMFFLVYNSVKTDFQLVSKDYYHDELKYQQIIDGSNAANRLSTDVKLVQAEDKLYIQFPVEIIGKAVSGNIWFYCPTDEKKDRRIEITVNETAMQVIPANYILPANYIAKISWRAGGMNYYTEKEIKIR